MMSSASKIILDRHGKPNAFAIFDQATETYLISNGYDRYTQRPLMLLTGKGHDYARREIKWQRGR